jgi:putative PEP-CTERM system TPR-repeat lipoprotein
MTSRAHTTLRLSALALAIGGTLFVSGCNRGDSPDALLAKAKQAIEANDRKAAEIHLKNLLQKEDSAEARMLLGSMHRKSADFRAAEKEFRRAVEMGKDRNIAAPPLLEAMFQSGDYQKLIDDARNLAVDQPAAKASVLTTVGRAYLSLNRMDEGKRSLNEALSADPNHLPAKVSLLALEAATADRAVAMGKLDALIAQHPNSVDALTLKGDLFLIEGKLAEARTLFESVVKAEPTNVMGLAKVVAIGIDLRDFESAGKSLNQLISISPASPGTLHLRALYEFRQNRLEPAREAIQNALKLAPDYLPSITLAGNIFLALNSYEQAERYGRMVLERAPNALQGYRLLGATYLRLNAPERALQTVQPVLDRKIDDATILSIAGEAALKLNDGTKAAEYFAKSAALDPNDPSKRTGLALSKMVTGDREKAFAELEQAVEIDSKSYQADFALIMARVRDKQYDKALESVTRLEKKLPQSPIAANLKGLVYLAKGDQPSARKAFGEALQYDPAFFASAANLASMDLRDNKPTDAKSRYEGVLKKDPKNAQALIALARLTAQTNGPREEVLKYLRQAKNSNPGAAPPVLALANYQIEINEPRDAIQTLQEGLASTPDRTEFLDLLGATYMRINERPQAIETYEKLLRLNPKSAALNYRMGELRAAIRDETGALSAFRRAAELAPQAVEPRIAIASVLLRQGKKAEARQIADSMKKDLPNSPAGLSLEGDIAALDGNWPAAISSFKKALSANRSVPIGIKLHQAYVRSGKDTEAASMLADWFKQSPEDVTMRLYAGEFELGRKNWKGAAAQYQEVLKADPKNAVALNNAAWSTHQLKDPQAIKLAEQAYALAPQNAAIIDTLGTILVDTGNATRGIELLRQAVNLAPRTPEYRLHLAEALMKAGDKGGAKTQVDTIQKEHPGTQAAAGAKELAEKL